MGETTSIDDYHHHHIHAGHGDQQTQRHSSLGGHGSSQRDSGQLGYGIYISVCLFVTEEILCIIELGQTMAH